MTPPRRPSRSAGAVDAVFKDTADLIHDFAGGAADDMGLSSSAYEDMAAVFGAQFKNMGVATDDLVPQTDDLIGLGADLAAQFGGSTADAVGALSSLLRGERDPIERYGVSIKQADIEAQKAALGLGGLEGEADKMATTQATLALLTEQTADATGAFARESDTAAGQTARTTAAFEDTKAELGRALLPIVVKAADIFNKLAKFIGENTGVFQFLAVAIITLTGVTWALNAAMAANPITLVVIAVVALVAAIVLAYQNCETFRKVVDAAANVAQAAFEAVKKAVDVVWDVIQGVWRWIRDNWPLLLAILTGPIGIAVAMIIKHWDTVKNAIQTVIDVIRGALVGAFNWVKSVAVGVVNSLVTAWNWLRDVVAGVASSIHGSVQWVIDKLNALWGLITGGLASAWSTAYNTAKWFLTAIRDAVGWVIDKLNVLWGWLTNNLGDAWSRSFNTAKWFLTAIRDAIQWIIDKVNALIGVIANIKFPSPPGWLKSAAGFVGGIFKATPAPPPVFVRPNRYSVASATRRALGARRSRMAGTAGGGVTINVNGALDADSVARQVERLLVGRQRRLSGVVIRGVA